MPAQQFSKGPAERIRPDWKKASGTFAATFSNRQFGVIGASTHQRAEFVPFGGKFVRACMVWEAPATVAAWEVNAYAMASGRAYAETEPKNPDGTPVVWATGGPLQVAAGPAGGQDITETLSPKHLLYVHPDATQPKWGALYFRARNTTANAGRGRVFTGSNGRINLISQVAARYRSRYEFAAAATAINADAFPLTSSADPNDSTRNITAFQYFLETLEPTKLVILGGDSRTQGEGSTSNLWGWMARTIEALWMEGEAVGYEFHGRQGTTHASTHAMMMDRLNKTSRRLPDMAIYQPSSTNGSTWTRAQVDADCARCFEFADRCRALGVQPIFMTMHPSTTATTAEGVANWKRLNDWIVASGVPYLEFHARPQFNNGAPIPALPTNLGLTADAGHLNNAGQEFAKNVEVLAKMRRWLAA